MPEHEQDAADAPQGNLAGPASESTTFEADAASEVGEPQAEELAASQEPGLVAEDAPLEEASALAESETVSEQEGGGEPEATEPDEEPEETPAAEPGTEEAAS